MKSSDDFKRIIGAHLDKVAAVDSSFAEKMKKEGKSLDNCITYILNTVKASGCNGFADDEIFGMALHYYDEDNIDVGKPISGQVVVNHKIELTEKEKNQAREKAKKEFEETQLRDLHKSQERKEARENRLKDKIKAKELERKAEEAEQRAKKIEVEKRIKRAKNAPKDPVRRLHREIQERIAV